MFLTQLNTCNIKITNKYITTNSYNWVNHETQQKSMIETNHHMGIKK